MWAGWRDTVRARECFVNSNGKSGKGFLGVKGSGEVADLLELRDTHVESAALREAVTLG